MKIKRMVKRLFAVGTGAAMLGATAMGAFAAADLKDYPTMFVTDGTFNGFFVVGEKAASVDNLAMTDIASSMKYVKPAAVAKATTSVQGDAWLVGTSSKKFEMVNSNVSESTLHGENLNAISTFIGDDELQALKDGTWSTNEQNYGYQQFMFFDYGAGATATTFGIVKYAENDQDKLADHFFFKNDGQIARYRLEFTSTAQSDVTDSAGTADTTGTYLDDFENTDITMMGKPYTVVLARRPGTGSLGAQNSVKLTLMAGAAHDTVLEGETKSYTVGEKAYEVTLSYVDDDEAKFIVNGEATNKLKVGETYVLKDKSEVGVSEILYQSYAGGVHSATFFVGAQKMELRDDDTRGSNITGGYALRIGSEDIDGSLVMISGTDNNVTFSVSTIEVNMTAEDDYFVGASEKLSDVIVLAGEEKEVLMGGAFDVEYKGLTEEKTNDIGLKTSSSRRYHLHVYDGDGKLVELPVAYAQGNWNLSFSEESFEGTRNNQKRLIVTEGTSGDGLTLNSEGGADKIHKDDFFVLTSGDATSGAAKSYLLQYKQSDAQTKTSPKIKFKNLGSSETLEYSITSQTTTGTVATIKLGGYSFIVENSSAMGADDFNVTIDLDGGGAVGANTVNFVDYYGSQWAFTAINVTLSDVTLGAGTTVNASSQDYIMLTQTTPNADDYDNQLPTTVVLNITATTGPETRVAVKSAVNPAAGDGLSLLTPSGKTEVSYGYTSMGTYITYNQPSSDPQEVILKYPEKQRLPQVYFTSGATKTSTSTGGDMTPVTVVDATKLDSEIADAKAQNLVVVGGPCVNTVAMELMGSPADCTEGFTPGRARVKLWEHANGNMAMLVAGYSGADTRLAGKVLAHRAKELSGMEVEVEGTTYTDATISAPTPVAKKVEPVATESVATTTQ